MRTAYNPAAADRTNSEGSVHSVLVCGAGIAGLVVACWLARAGFDVTVIGRPTSPVRADSPSIFAGRRLR